MDNNNSEKDLCIRKKGFVIAAFGIVLQMVAAIVGSRLLNQSEAQTVLARMNEPGMILMGFGFLYAGYDEFKIKAPRLTKALMVLLPIFFVILLARMLIQSI